MVCRFWRIMGLWYIVFCRCVIHRFWCIVCLRGILWGRCILCFRSMRRFVWSLRLVWFWLIIVWFWMVHWFRFLGCFISNFMFWGFLIAFYWFCGLLICRFWFLWHFLTISWSSMWLRRVWLRFFVCWLWVERSVYWRRFVCRLWLIRFSMLCWRWMISWLWSMVIALMILILMWINRLWSVRCLRVVDWLVSIWRLVWCLWLMITCGLMVRWYRWMI